MESVGVVVSCGGGVAEIEVRRVSACEGCHKNAEGGCSVCTLMGGEGSRAARTVVRDPLGVRVGDRVRVESPAAHILSLAAAVFLLPLLFGLLGFLLACALDGGAVWQAVGALSGALVCFALLRVLSALMARRAPCAVIVEVLE